MPNPDRSRTRIATVCALLNQHDARYILVGAAAMQLWGTTRATRDVDILIEPTTDNAQRVLEALGELPFQVAKDVTATDLLSRTVTMIGDTPNVDVLTRAWNVRWEDASRNVAVIDLEGVPVPVLSLPLLIASKRTGRLQDDADILVLEALRLERER
jgi:hypothetical protein